MKKIYSLFIAIFLFFTLKVNGQGWVLYDGRDFPNNILSGWSIGDLSTPPVDYSIINTFNPGNKVLYETSTNNTYKKTFRLGVNNVGDQPPASTWVFRTKAGTKESSMEFELHGGNGSSAYRVNLRLYPYKKGGYIKLQYVDFTGVYPADSSLDVTAWHTYRITVENANQFKIYLDENPVPVITTSTTSGSINKYILRFGDIGNTFTEGYLDWFVYDLTGAYSPADKPVPAEFETTTQKADIVMMVNIDPQKAKNDDSTRVFLENLGYRVHYVGISNESNLLTRKSTLLDSLNSADLVIIGRSVSSSAFHSSRGRDIWNNEVERPILLIHPYVPRSGLPGSGTDLLSWFSTAGSHHLTGNKVQPGTLLTSKVLKPSHPIFQGVTISPDSIMPWSYTRDDGFYYDYKTNADVYNIHTCDSSIIIATWEPGKKFYQGAGATIWASGFRAYCGYGNDEDFVHYWSLTSEAQKVLKNGVALLVNMRYIPYKGWNYKLLKNILVDNGSLSPEFRPDVFEYTLNLTNGNIVTITPVDTLPPAGSYLMPYYSTGGGVINLGQKNDSIVVIKVISSTGKDTANYIIHIYNDPALDANLSSLSVNPGNLVPDFSPTITNYTVRVPSSVTSITINATPSNPEATVTGTGNFTNIPGTAIVRVTSKSGTVIKEYTINVQVLSNDASLSNLTVTPGTMTPAFNPDVTSYTVKVPQGTDTVRINATANHPAATVVGTGNFIQIPGQATITVTAEDGITTRNYVLDISFETGINQFTKNAISIYPNPVDRVLYVRSADQILTIAVYDVTGNQIKLIKPDSKLYELSFEGIKSGIYFVRIQTESNTIVRKITKR